MGDFDSITSVITLNVNVLNVSVKRRRPSDRTQQETMLFIRNSMHKCLGGKRAGKRRYAKSTPKRLGMGPPRPRRLQSAGTARAPSDEGVRFLRRCNDAEHGHTLQKTPEPLGDANTVAHVHTPRSRWEDRGRKPVRTRGTRAPRSDHPTRPPFAVQPTEPEQESGQTTKVLGPEEAA